MLQDWIVFIVDNEHYCHTVTAVKEVLRFQDLNEVPGAPPSVWGMLNLRGEVITVFSGWALFNLDFNLNRETSDLKIIVIETLQGKYGVVVDRVEQIIHIDPADITTERQGQMSEDNPVRGTIMIEGQLMIACDLTTICSTQSGQINL